MNTIKTYADEAPSLEEVQKFIGGNAEALELSNGDLLLVDEEAKLKQGISVNKEASKLKGQILLGNAIIIKHNIRGENW
tara:strand:+ start:259 stop:495 length:237 start_codon:yes stop_codon:yes gene_type:complete